MIKVLGSMDFEPFVETIENLPTGSKTVNRVRGQKVEKKLQASEMDGPKGKKSKH